MKRRALLLLAAMSFATCAQETPPPRSSAFDKVAAERLRDTPVYIERLVIEGRDPDAARRKAKPLEARFADSLNAPPAAGAVGLRPLDTKPCMSMPSTWNPIGNSYAPLTGCP